MVDSMANRTQNNSHVISTLMMWTRVTLDDDEATIIALDLLFNFALFGFSARS